jgi:endonuclease-3
VKVAQTNVGRVKKIALILGREYPGAKTPLKHKNPLQLLVATILSAQCTDERVNKVTPALFVKYKTATDFAAAKSAQLEGLIRSTGFYKNKTKSIIGCCRGLVEKFGGKVPPLLDELVELPGVGRKTANVVLGSCFDIPGIVVDTHVKRLANLLDLTKNSDPVKIESDLMKIVPRKDWNIFSLLLIFHGRRVCIARRPKCCECEIKALCPSNNCK